MFSSGLGRCRDADAHPARRTVTPAPTARSTLHRRLLFHFRPRRLPAAALRFTLTFGLGGTAVLLVLLQLATGMLLSLIYEPFPVLAHRSIRHLHEAVLFGGLIRSLHHWTGHALVVVVLFHLLRVLYQGALFGPRRTNWYIGLAMGSLVLMANFSGYLLPWDQLAFWAVTVATSMATYIPVIGTSLEEVLRGGPEVGAATLRQFHIIHAMLVPWALLVLLGFHCWQVRRAGGVLVRRDTAAASGDPQESVPFAPDLLTRELAAAAVVFTLLVLFSMLVNAPLGPMANPELTPATVKAPWYFLGLQELLLHVPPTLAVCVLPAALAAFLLLAPFHPAPGGRLPRWTLLSVTLCLVVLAALTVTGIWFRGPAMQLVVPW